MAFTTWLVGGLQGREILVESLYRKEDNYVERNIQLSQQSLQQGGFMRGQVYVCGVTQVMTAPTHTEFYNNCYATSPRNQDNGPPCQTCR